MAGEHKTCHFKRPKRLSVKIKVMNTTDTSVKILITLFIVFVLLIFWYLLFYIGWVENYSEGLKTGEVFKFSKKGLFFKSWEGTMYLGGAHLSGGSNSTLQLDKFNFSIPEKQQTQKGDVIKTLEKCSNERKICAIFYKQWFKWPIYLDSDYVVEKVEIKN